MSPLERNGRKLIGVLAHFPAGATSEDLRRAFEKETSLVRQSYYDALRFIKSKGWIIGGGRDQLYCLSPDKSWKEEPITSVGENLEKDRLVYLANSRAQRIEELQSENERLLDWSGSSDPNGVNTALTSLLKIVADNGATPRQRIKAAAAVLGYKTEGDTAQFVKKYLTSVCESTDIAIDYKIEAGELLRRHEAPRVTPDSVRPSYRTDTAEPVEPLADLVARRRARQDAYERELALNPAVDALPSDVSSALNATYSRHGK